MNRLASLGLTLLLAAACGGAAPTPSPVPTGPTPAPTATPRPTPSPTPSPPPTVSQACSDELAGMTDALEELDGRLDVGLTKADYGNRVGDISVESNRIDVEKLTAQGADCLGVALLLNAAFLEYIDANTIWGDCIQSTSCSTSSIEPQLQAHWLTAHQKIEDARRQLP